MAGNILTASRLQENDDLTCLYRNMGVVDRTRLAYVLDIYHMVLEFFSWTGPGDFMYIFASSSYHELHVLLEYPKMFRI